MTSIMRIDLNVPYAEKNEAKRWGARWDAALRTWYIENVKNLEPLMRWLPEHYKVSNYIVPELQLEYAPPVSGAKLRKLKKAEQRKKQREVARNTHFIAGPVTPRTDFSMPDPGCSCVPWEWCEHNPETANQKAAFVYPTKPEYSFDVAPEHLAHIRSILAE